MKKSLKNKFILFFLILILFLVNIPLFYFYFNFKKYLTDEIESKLENILEITNIFVLNNKNLNYLNKIIKINKIDSDLYYELKKQLKNIRIKTKCENIYLFDKNFKSILDSKKSIKKGWEYSYLSLDKYEIYKAIKLKKIIVSHLFRSKQGKLIMSAYKPVFINNKFVCMLAVDASNSLLNVINKLIEKILLFEAGSLALSLFLGIILSAYLLKPIDKLVKTAKKVSEGNTHVRSNLKRKDELGFLSKTLDDMINTLEQKVIKLQTISAVIAHEVRNPLSGMLGFVNLLKRQLDKEKLDKEKAEQLIMKINREINKLNLVTSDFLLFSKDKKINLTKIKIEKIISHLKKMISPEIENKNIEFIFNIEDIEINVDEYLFERALHNIISNAISAIKEEGKISINIKKYRNNIIIECVDTGTGIENQNLNKIFEPFYTTKNTGTGLGLAITKQIITLHSGEIEIKSNDGLTTVIIKIPC